jgi:hypothetical protein
VQVFKKTEKTMPFLLLLIPFFFLCAAQGFAQQIPLDKKIYTATRTTTPPEIDGLLEATIWQQSPKAENFVQLDPLPGGPSYQESSVQVLYDDDAIYIGAILYDTAPDSILKELSPRDQIANTDWFALQIDPYNAGQIAFEFAVTPSNIQIDRRITAPDEIDSSWDAVWISAVSITEEGWVVEIEIPYSALRFPSTQEQTWSINFGRYIRRVRQEMWWNEKNPSIRNTLFQNGILTGIGNIKSPPRISISPFLAGYADKNNRNVQAPWRTNLTGGMDLKIGLSDAFTLDMALIPDFGQVRFDDQVLNLTPFEIQFEDNRPFFTEGTELFQRSDLFYSRRIGERPFFSNALKEQLPEGSSQLQIPFSNDLLNATKLSGRTNKGLGIGLFNAVENRMWAQYIDSNGDKQTLLANPFTNYNVLVLDQNLKNNSYASLVNTHVWREGKEAYNANVTALETGLRNKDNSYMFTANGILSAKQFQNYTELGYAFKSYFEKTKGIWQYKLSYYEKSDRYDPTDLGFLLRANERKSIANLRYNIFSPWKFLNRGFVAMTSLYERLHTPDVFTNLGFNLNSFFMTRKFFAFSIYGNAEPITTFDYFEPRTRDFSRFYAFPQNYQLGGFISTDYRRKFAYDLNVWYRWFDDEGRNAWQIRFSPRFRLSDHFFFTWSTAYFNLYQDVGFAAARSNSLGFDSLQAGDILFSRRNQHVLDHLLSARYNFTPYHNITLRMRHYWTQVDFQSFHLLGQEGELQPTAYTGKDAENNFVNSLTYNLFTIDLVYTWRFAPGSDLIVVWKNQLDEVQNRIDIPYSRSVGDILNNPQFNSFSVKLIYYMDYVLLKRRLQGRRVRLL